jgi:hypothetical protein
MKTNSQRPPQKPLWKMTDGQPVGCGICEDGLHKTGIAVVDPDLGPVCLRCGPHLIVALKAMFTAMRRVM